MATDGTPEAVERALIHDGSLALLADAGVWEAVAPWVPRIPVQPPAPGVVRARLRARAGSPVFDVPAGAPTLELREVRGWVLPGGTILLHGPGGRVSAVVDLPAREAEVRLRVPAEPGDAFGVELFAAFTLASAFLLGRLGRTLVHAGAVVGPGERAWLLAGGTFSGKSTTCVSLMGAGCDYLADDHLVLGRGADGAVTVEGWPRRFNLDRGYGDGVSQGVRARVEPDALGPGRWRRAAPLGALLFPRVQAELPTAAEPMHPAAALGGLLQQSPWLLADGGAAKEVLALLKAAAGAPAFALRLGADTYGDGRRLRAVLEGAVRGGETHGLAPTSPYA